MSIFDVQPRIFDGIVSRHWHTQVGHLLIAVGVFGGIGGFLGWLALSGWPGFQLGCVVGGLFYTVREWEAHRYYNSRFRAGEITKAEHRLHIWDSFNDALLPWAACFPIATWEWRLWWAWSALWLWVAVRYVLVPPGQAGGMRG